MEGLAALSQSFGQTIAQGLPQQVQQRRELDQRKAEADVTAKNAERGLGIQERYAATAEKQAALAADEAAYARSLGPTPGEAQKQRSLGVKALETDIAAKEFSLERDRARATVEDETARLALEDQRLRNKISATFGMEAAQTELNLKKASLGAEKNRQSQSMVETFLRIADFQRQGQAIDRADKRGDAELLLRQKELQLRKAQMLHDNAMKNVDMAINVEQQNKQMATQLLSINLSNEADLMKYLFGPLAEQHGVVPGSPEHQALITPIMRSWKALSGAATYSLGTATGKNAESVVGRMGTATKDLSVLSDQFASGEIDEPTYVAKTEELIKDSLKAVERTAAPDRVSKVEPDPTDIGPYTWFAGTPMTKYREAEVKEVARRSKELGSERLLAELNRKNPGTYVRWRGKIRDLPPSHQLSPGKGDSDVVLGPLAKQFLDRTIGGEDEPAQLEEAYMSLIDRNELQPDENVDDPKVFAKIVKHAYTQFVQATNERRQLMRF